MDSVRLAQHQGRILQFIIKGCDKWADQRQDDVKNHKKEADRTRWTRHQILEDTNCPASRRRAVMRDHGHYFLVYIVRSFGFASMVRRSAARFTQTYTLATISAMDCTTGRSRSEIESIINRPSPG